MRIVKTKLIFKVNNENITKLTYKIITKSLILKYNKSLVLKAPHFLTIENYKWRAINPTLKTFYKPLGSSRINKTTKRITIYRLIMPKFSCIFKFNRTTKLCQHLLTVETKNSELRLSDEQELVQLSWFTQRGDWSLFGIHGQVGMLNSWKAIEM